METGDLFSLLVQYHYDINLPKCLPYISKGVLSPPSKKHNIEGVYENDLYNGLLLAANGDTLTDKLLREDIVLDEEITEPAAVPDREGLFSYLRREVGSDNADPDGAFIYDNVNKMITRVYDLNNTPGKLERLQYSSFNGAIPPDFFTLTGEQRKLGTKTRMALKLPRAYPEIHTFQIKQTAYTPLGLGKVTHFTKDGLREEFFFRVDHHDSENIVGVYRRYVTEGGKIVLAQERVIDKEYEEKKVLTPQYG